MSLTIEYGTFTFTQDEPSLTVEKTVEYSESSAQERERARISFNGKVQGSTTEGVVAQVDALLGAAYGVDQNLLVKNGTAVISHMSYYSGSCLKGPRCTGISFPEATGAELAAGGVRTYRLEFEAITEKASPTYGNVVNFRETLSFSGGSALYQVLDTIEGTAEVWQVTTQSAWRATQEGEATGRTSHPTPVAAIWPTYRVDNNGAERDSPTMVECNTDGTAATKRMYRTRWRYEYAASSNVFSGGTPHDWYIG